MNSVILLLLCLTLVNGHGWWWCDSCVADCDDSWWCKWCHGVKEACEETITITNCETDCTSEIDNDKLICYRLDNEYKNIFGSHGDSAKSRACVEQCSTEMDQKCVDICSDCLAITEADGMCLKFLTIPSLCQNGEEKIGAETEINERFGDHCVDSCKMRMEDQCKTTRPCLHCDSAVINKNHCGYLAELEFGLNPSVTEDAVNKHIGEYEKEDGSSLNCVTECKDSMNSICDGLVNIDTVDWIDTEDWNNGAGFNCEAYRTNQWCDGKCGAGRGWRWSTWGDIKCSEGNPLENCARSCGCGNEFSCVDSHPDSCERKIIDDTICIRGQCEVVDEKNSWVLKKCAKSCGCCKSCDNTYCAGDATCSMDETNFCSCSDGSECIIVEEVLEDEIIEEEEEDEIKAPAANPCDDFKCSDNEECIGESGKPECYCGKVICGESQVCNDQDKDGLTLICTKVNSEGSADISQL